MLQRPPDTLVRRFQSLVERYHFQPLQAKKGHEHKIESQARDDRSPIHCDMRLFAAAIGAGTEESLCGVPHLAKSGAAPWHKYGFLCGS